MMAELVSQIMEHYSAIFAVIMNSEGKAKGKVVNTNYNADSWPAAIFSPRWLLAENVCLQSFLLA